MNEVTEEVMSFSMAVLGRAINFGRIISIQKNICTYRVCVIFSPGTLTRPSLLGESARMSFPLGYKYYKSKNHTYFAVF